MTGGDFVYSFSVRADTPLRMVDRRSLVRTGPIDHPLFPEGADVWVASDGMKVILHVMKFAAAWGDLPVISLSRNVVPPSPQDLDAVFQILFEEPWLAYPLTSSAQAGLIAFGVPRNVESSQVSAAVEKVVASYNAASMSMVEGAGKSAPRPTQPIVPSPLVDVEKLVLEDGRQLRRDPSLELAMGTRCWSAADGLRVVASQDEAFGRHLHVSLSYGKRGWPPTTMDVNAVRRAFFPPDAETCFQSPSEAQTTAVHIHEVPHGSTREQLLEALREQGRAFGSLFERVREDS